MMRTDFIKNSEARKGRKNEIEKIFNILGNKPEVPARYLVNRIIKNKNGVRFAWLNGARAIGRFTKWIFVKHDLFA